MKVLKILSLIILFWGFIVTIKNSYLILKNKIKYSLFYLILNFLYLILPTIYIILN